MEVDEKDKLYHSNQVLILLVRAQRYRVQRMPCVVAL